METLSLVITSCGGTSKVISLRLTFIILSTKGMIKIIPGPLLAMSLPKRKITPLSYSFIILTTCVRINIKITTATIYGVIVSSFF
jgi:hypothetical protein